MDIEIATPELAKLSRMSCLSRAYSDKALRLEQKEAGLGRAASTKAILVN